MNATSPIANNALGARLGTPLAGDPAGTAGSAVSWGAIFAGAAGAAALSMILLVLGTGLGLSSVSPWTGQGMGATTMGVSTIVWITLTQVAASGMGGYLAGRLRTKWMSVHTDEVYFRDTAHGFLAWAVATLVTAALLTSAIAGVLGTGVKAGSAVVGGAATAAVGGASALGLGDKGDSKSVGDSGGESGGDSMGGLTLSYGLDTLFRADPAAAQTAGAQTGATPVGTATSSIGQTAANPAPSGTANASTSTAEVARIFSNGLRSGTLSQEDSRYVGQLIAARTGLSQADAQKRVSDTFASVQAKLKEAETTARDAADKARKASSYAALWLFVSLLVGAFVASLAATLGGRQRDL